MTEHQTDDDRTYRMDFESINEVIDHLDRDRPSDSGASSVEDSAEEEWDLGIGWDGAMSAYVGGWSEGAKKAYDLAERLRPAPKANRTTLHRSVTGAFPNVGAHLAGAPNSMYQVSKKQATGRPYVHLYMPISFSGSMNAETAFDRGCALVAITDALETAGCRIKITLTRTSDIASRDRICMRFMVKNYGDRLDVDQLIFTAAHPAMFRRIGFALQERSGFGPVRNATLLGYGSPCDLRDTDTEPDGKAVLVKFPRLERHHTGWTPERFLSDMVAALPEEISTEIEGE